MDEPDPQWLVQEPEGPKAPKTPGRWRGMWPSDANRLEDAYRTGLEEVLVYGRKYVVNLKERVVKPLFYREGEGCGSRPVRRATYFVRKGGMWAPYSEKDADRLEDLYASAKVQLRSASREQVETPLEDGESKVVMTRKNVSGQGENNRTYFDDFDIECVQKPIKAPSILQTTFTKTIHEVRRGCPEAGVWGGVKLEEDDIPRQSRPPQHLVFIIHGVGESLFSKSWQGMPSLRDCCATMRTLAMDLRETQHIEQKEFGTGIAAKEGDGDKKVRERDSAGSQQEEGGDENGDEAAGVGRKVDGDDKDEEADPRRHEGSDCAGYVEFLPVEWFEEVHGKPDAEDADTVSVADMSLPTIPAFREFANHAVMDVMYYLTPRIQRRMLNIVVSELNRMWEAFRKYTPDFKGKVAIMGHSLGSVIAHDILKGQPGGIILTPDGIPDVEIPVLKFEPHALVVVGSPIGTFLSLRGSRVRENMFEFKTTEKFLNIFHVPHKGGDRLHVKVKKMRGDVTAVVNMMSKTADQSLRTLQKSWQSTLESVTGNSMTRTRSGTVDEVSEEVQDDAVKQMGERLDWVLQESPLEGMHPWAGAVFAHGSYFDNVDLIMFMLRCLDGEPLMQPEEVEAS